MLLTIPAAVALFISGGAFVQVFMQAGAFTADDAAVTGLLVSGLVIGLPAYVLVKVLTPNFFARKDTRTPVYTAAISLIVAIVLNLILVPRIGVLSLAIAGAAGAWVNTVLLYAILARRGYFKLSGDVARRLAKITLACLPMGAALYGIMQYAGPMFSGSLAERALSITALIAAGLVTFAIPAAMLGILDKSTFQRLMKRQA